MFGFHRALSFRSPHLDRFYDFLQPLQFQSSSSNGALAGPVCRINPQFIQNYNQDSTGFTMFASYPVKRLRSLAWALRTDLRAPASPPLTMLPASCLRIFNFRSISGPSALQGIVSSTLTPTITYNTIDNPTNQHSGKSIFYSLGFTGGPLGGNVILLPTFLTGSISIPFKNAVMSSAFTPVPRIRPDSRQGSAAVQPLSTWVVKTMFALRSPFDLAGRLYPAGFGGAHLLSRPHRWRGSSHLHRAGANLYCYSAWR